MSKTQQQTLKKYFTFPVKSNHDVKEEDTSDSNQTKKVLSKMMKFRQNRIKNESDHPQRKPVETERSIQQMERSNGNGDSLKSNTMSSSISLELESVSSRKRPRIPDKFTGKKKFSSSDNQSSREIDLSRKYLKSKCSFCESTLAAIIVKGKLMGSQPKPLCLTHYYTTRTVTITHPKRIQALPSSKPSMNSTTSSSTTSSSSSQFDKQLPDVQDLFAQAFTELQKEIAEESARSFNRMSKSSDPLSLLGEEGSTHQKWKKQKLLQIQQKRHRRQQLQKHFKLDNKDSLKGTQRNDKAKERTENTEGGYMKELKLPEKLVKHEQQQRDLVHLQLESPTVLMNKRKKIKSKTHRQSTSQKLPISSVSSPNPYKRRKPSKKPYWDLSSSTSAPTSTTRIGSESKTNPLSSKASNQSVSSSVSKIICPNPKCKSINIDEISSSGSSSHNLNYHSTTNAQAMTKGEIWGFKDRENDGYVVRIMKNCLDCGKVWQVDDT